jgi:hypothetical protein
MGVGLFLSTPFFLKGGYIGGTPLNKAYKEWLSEVIVNEGHEALIVDVLQELKKKYPVGDPNSYNVAVRGVSKYTQVEYISLCDVWAHRTLNTPMLLWWCRAVGVQMGLSVPLIDWAFYKLVFERKNKSL